MTSSISKSCIKIVWIAIVAVIVLSFSVTNQVHAFQKKADTVSTSDVQFTDIPTAADSIAIRKKAAAEAAKAKPASQTTVTKPEAPKTLWQIFIEGLLGGFTALLLPCIYPLLPLTVSFFLKIGGNRLKAAGLSI